MLVLSRKINQTICIGKDIVIRVVKINGSTIRLGIDAPGNVEILRGELLNHWSSPDGTDSFRLNFDPPSTLNRAMSKRTNLIPRADSARRG